MSVRWAVDRAELDPEFAADVDELFRADDDAWVIHYGFRSAEVQGRLYAQGRTTPGPIVTNAPPGHSPHEFGLAVDFHAAQDGAAAYDHTTPAWHRIMAKVDAHPRLHGGWKFPPAAPPDFDHIQAVSWFKKREQLRLEGKW